MNKIFLIPYKEKYFLCLQENEEQAKENFINSPDFQDDKIKEEWFSYTYPERTMQIKKELNVTLLTEEKDYLVNDANQSHTIIKITLKGIDHFLITVRKHSPIEPLVRYNPPTKLKEKISNLFEKLSHEKS